MSGDDRPDPLSVLAGLTDRVWLVGGAVRDERLGRPVTDFDLAVDGDARALARGLGRVTGASAFALSEAYGAWRVTAADRRWQVDLTPLTGATLLEDLANRDLTVNAIARPLGDGEPIDPHGGLADLAAGRLRMVGAGAFGADPLRVMRLARLSIELGFTIDPDTLAAARDAATGLARVAGERIFAELRAILAGPDPVAGLDALEAVGATAIVLPELIALHGVEQSVYHHRDVHGHTMEAIAHAVALRREPTEVIGLPDTAGASVTAWLAQPLADELDRGEVLVWGALFHDIAKPQTRAVGEGGRISFYGHDLRGADQARAILGRLRASERLSTHVAALTRHHLRLGFLVHARPLTARDRFNYLAAVTPVGPDVTLLTAADRLATRGRNGERAIAAHLELLREVWPATLAWETDRPRPPIRGDALAAALDRPPGSWLSEALAELTAARYAGELDETAEAAVAHARAWLAR